LAIECNTEFAGTIVVGCALRVKIRTIAGNSSNNPWHGVFLVVVFQEMRMRTFVWSFILAVMVSVGVTEDSAVAQDSLTIQNRIEFDAYRNAIGETTPEARSAALEDFLAKFPDTVVKTLALNTLLTTYQQLNDQPNTLKTAKRILKADPNNLRAAFVFVFLAKREAIANAAGPTPVGATGRAPSNAAGKLLGATGAAPFNAIGAVPFNAAGAAPANAASRTPHNSAGPVPANAAGPTPIMGNPQALLHDAANVARAALKITAPSPDSGVTPGDFANLKVATTPVFLSVLAADAQATQNYEEAIGFYLDELKSYPDLALPAAQSGINETYLLGQAYLQLDPKDLPNAIFYLTRAAQYAPHAAKDSVEKAAEYWYMKYHGGMDGFDQIKRLALENAKPPASYRPIPAPLLPPAEKLAHDAVLAANTPEGLRNLALVDKEFILANGNQEDAEKLWAVMKGVRARIPGVVLKATANSVQMAVTPDAQQSDIPDFTVNFPKPLETIPPIGSTASFDSTFDAYSRTPILIIMSDGSQESPAKRSPVRRPGAAQSAPVNN